MLDHGVRRIEACPAGPAAAEAQVGVLAVEEELLVEQADPVEHLATVNGRASAGTENLFGRAEAFGRLEIAALLAGAIGCDAGAQQRKPRAIVGGEQQVGIRGGQRPAHPRGRRAEAVYSLMHVVPVHHAFGRNRAEAVAGEYVGRA